MRNKWGFMEKVEDAGKGMQDMLQTWDKIAQAAAEQFAEQAAAKWQAQIHARIQGLGHAIYCMKQAAQAWGVARAAEMQRPEATYFMKQKQERNTV